MEQDVMDLLLGLGPKGMRTQKIKMRDLSKRAGTDVVFTVRELGYNEIKDIHRMEGGRPDGDIAVAVVLAGVREPNLRAAELRERYSAPTPAELLPKMLSAGEIDELAMRIERLSGYRRSVTEIVGDVKKNSMTETGKPS
ncbi:MAG: hypothetical protein KH050_12545 [Clostridiaceae bacterium]|nr:hypothetical protein [Clostridiaceae bacterium]